MNAPMTSMRQVASLLTLTLGCAAPLQAAPFLTPTYGVSKTSDIVYGTGLINNGAATLDLLLDIYRPTVISEPLPDKSPGIVAIHGGAWQVGSKTDSSVSQFASLLASLGYVVTSINYRLLGHNVPETHGPADLMDLSFVPDAEHGGFDLPQPQTSYTINAGIEDAAKAIGWMRASAATYNIDPNHIAIGGASAGAFNSLAHAYYNTDPNLAPQAVLSYVGALAGAESLIQAGEVPAFVVNGAVDPLVPLSVAQATVDQMNAAGVYNEFYVQPGVGHDVDFNLVFGGQTLLAHNIDFLAQFLVPEPSSFALCALAALALGSRCRLVRACRKRR
jgi:acetyl esterase/lipase